MKITTRAVLDKGVPRFLRSVRTGGQGAGQLTPHGASRVSPNPQLEMLSLVQPYLVLLIFPHLSPIPDELPSLAPELHLLPVGRPGRCLHPDLVVPGQAGPLQRRECSGLAILQPVQGDAGGQHDQGLPQPCQEHMQGQNSEVGCVGLVGGRTGRERTKLLLWKEGGGNGMSHSQLCFRIRNWGLASPIFLHLLFTLTATFSC